jgi:hypothetical protein
MQFLDRQMAITLGEQKIGQRDALPCRAKPAMAQPDFDVRSGIRHILFLLPRVSSDQVQTEDITFALSSFNSFLFATCLEA